MNIVRKKFAPRALAAYGSVVFFRIISNAALGIISLVTARLLGPDLRGRFLTGLTVAGIVCIVATCGINVSLRRGLRSESSRPYLLGSYVGASLILSCAAALGAPFPFVLAFGTDSAELSNTLALSVQCASLTISVLLVEAVHALERHGMGALFDAIGSVSGLVLVTTYVTMGHTVTLAGLLFCTSGGCLIQGLICFVVLAKEPDFRSANRADITRLFAESRQNYGTIVGLTFLMKGDRYLLAYALGPTAVSIYATAATVSELIWLPAQGIANYFYSKARGRASLEWAAKRTFVTLAFAGLLLALLSPIMIRTLFGRGYASSIPLVWLLIPGSVAMTIYFLDSARLMGEGRGIETRRQLVGPLVILIVGASILAKTVGLGAAAVACSAAYILLGSTARRAVLKGDGNTKGEPNDSSL